MTPESALRVRELRKSYGPREVLRGVSLDVGVGEIRGLLGANGAGKSTLIGCLSGAAKPDSGKIVVRGVEHSSFTPRTAFAEGIAVIYQQFSVISELSVSDNIFLGDEATRAGRVDRKHQDEISIDLIESLGAHIDPRLRIADLNVGERQLVEIAKVMRRKPRVLVLDEPTAALSDLESKALSDRLRSLRERHDVGIVYVSHLLNEVFDLVDSVTVLRDGRIELDEVLTDTSPRDVVSAIAPSFDPQFTRKPTKSADRASAHLVASGLATGFVGPIDLQVDHDERVALFGLLGSGRTETLEMVLGIRLRDAGTMTLDGTPHDPRSPRDSIAAGLSFVPANRKERGIFAALTARDNVVLPHYDAMGRLPVLRNFGEEARVFTKVAGDVNLSPPDPRALGSSFSGGNQQKLVVSRWLVEGADTKFLLLDEPTQGIDIGARQDLYDLIDRLVIDSGLTVLFATSDPEEAMQLADRIIVLNRGRVVLETRPSQTSTDNLLHAAHGIVSPDRDEN